MATYKCAGENAYNLVKLSNVVILDLHLDQQIRVKVLERVIFMHVSVARTIEVKREVGIHLFTVVSCFLKRMLRYPSNDTKVSHISHFYSIHSELRLAT